MPGARLGYEKFYATSRLDLFLRQPRHRRANQQLKKQPGRKLTMIPLIAATYFMVAGGPYGLEDVVQKAGYGRALLILLVTPLVWSLPVALLVGELSAALPEEGGYYAWVRRALGPFWGFQEAWLSLVASIFDMAIYPTLFVLYLGAMWPWAARAWHPVLIGGVLIAVCALWNIAGARAVGDGSVLLMVLLLAPFAVISGLALFHRTPAAASQAAHYDLLGGVLVAMWNYMGWDNASTVAGEVENPQRTYPWAMLICTGLVSFSYVLPVGAIAHYGLDASRWTTGGWVDAARALGGPTLALAVGLGGMICGAGMFNALVMSYTRVPFAMAEDGFLPAFLRRRNRSDAPWTSILLCSAAWTLCLTLGFERLVELDILLYGSALLLEFLALIVLRIKEPALPRPFRVPGGLAGCLAFTAGPTFVLLLALVEGPREHAGPVSALVLGALLAGAGIVLYFVANLRRRATLAQPARATD